MKALVVDEFKHFEESEIGELPRPEAGPQDVIVEVAVSDVNFPDVLFVEGKYQALPPLPFAPGMGASGTVVAVGSEVDGLEPGQRVLALPDHGTFAQFARVPAHCCYPIPDGVSDETAAAMGLVFQTAFFALTDRGQIEAGDHVLVYGATGGIGMASVQLAKALGAASVTAVVRGEEAKDFALEIGADSTIDASLAEDPAAFVAAVMEATGGHGADVVIDPVGEPLTGVTPKAMAWRGRLVIVGFASGNIPNIRSGYLLVRNISASGIQWTDYRDRQPDRVADAQKRLFDLVLSGDLDPKISDRYPLEDVTKALARFREGGLRGKQVLVVGE